MDYHKIERSKQRACFLVLAGAVLLGIAVLGLPFERWITRVYLERDPYETFTKSIAADAHELTGLPCKVSIRDDPLRGSILFNRANHYRVEGQVKGFEIILHPEVETITVVAYGQGMGEKTTDLLPVKKTLGCFGSWPQGDKDFQILRDCRWSLREAGVQKLTWGRVGELSQRIHQTISLWSKKPSLSYQPLPRLWNLAIQRFQYFYAAFFAAVILGFALVGCGGWQLWKLYKNYLESELRRAPTAWAEDQVRLILNFGSFLLCSLGLLSKAQQSDIKIAQKERDQQREEENKKRRRNRGSLAADANKLPPGGQEQVLEIEGTSSCLSGRLPDQKIDCYDLPSTEFPDFTDCLPEKGQGQVTAEMVKAILLFFLNLGETGPVIEGDFHPEAKLQEWVISWYQARGRGKFDQSQYSGALNRLTTEANLIIVQGEPPKQQLSMRMNPSGMSQVIAEMWARIVLFGMLFKKNT